MMLTEICYKIRNFFTAEEDKHIGDYSIVDGQLMPGLDIADGQYYRIVGSIFNDGVHKFGDENDILKDENEFHGGVWLMRIPQDVIDLAAEIEEWQKKYGDIESANMSPFSHETLGPYSYTKAQGFAATGGGMLTSWDVVFASRLNPYRRIRI